MALVIFFVFILDFYVESFCLSKLDSAMTAKIGSISSFIGGLFFALLWDQPWAWTVHEWHHGNAGAEKHLLSGGTIFSALFFILGELDYLSLLCRQCSVGSFFWSLGLLCDTNSRLEGEGVVLREKNPCLVSLHRKPKRGKKLEANESCLQRRLGFIILVFEISISRVNLFCTY